MVLAFGIYYYRWALFDLFLAPSAETIPPTVPAASFSSPETVLDSEPPEEVNINNSTTILNEVTLNEFNLAVPFMVQAPLGDWNLPYQEACEEAAVIMVNYYWQGKDLSADLAAQEIIDLVAWEETNKGDYKDTTIAETARLVEEYWGYETRVIDNPTVDLIKELIKQGYPVIAPFAGQEIGNPFYSGQGPLYHMMVIKGYQGDDFITNDPGTRRGADYIYDAAHLLAVMHDWNFGQVATGAARILVIFPDAPPLVNF